MDRTAFADCAVMLASLALAAGCGAKTSPPPQDAAPRVLADLQTASPGPWRRGGGAPISVSSLECAEGWYPPPAELNAADRIAPPRSSDPNPGRFDAEPPRRQPTRELPRQPAPDDAADQPAMMRPGQQEAIRAISKPRKLVEYHAPRQTAAQMPQPASQAPSERGTLPWAFARRRSVEMDSALQAAGEHVRSGFRLAERNALYLARAEFIAALELVAEANDVQQNTCFYTDALNAGLVALAESSDFSQRRPVGKRLDIARIVSGHKTPILKNPPHNHLAPTLAAQRYDAYAQEQLAAAAALEPNASMALFGLGKAAIATGTVSPAQRMESTAQAAALYRAALMADSRNFRAANELGVIQARKGNLLEARDLLVHSARLAPHPATHRNLAAVYGKLGQTQLAEHAKTEATKLEAAGYRRGGPPVQWLDPIAFASTAPASDSLLPPASGPTTLPGAQTPPEPQEKAATTAKRGLTDWLPWSVRR